jgi:hypothetical protein
MSCDCGSGSERTLWTPTPPLYKPTEILPGENLDCYSRRASDDGPKDDARIAPNNKILNTQITADGSLSVLEQFKLSEGPRTASFWSMNPSIPGLTFSVSGRLSGTVDTSVENQTFKVTVSATDGQGVIDSREYTFCPARPQMGQSLSIQQPYKPSSGGCKIISGFGPRIHPITKVQKLHKGQDWVAVSASAKGQGTIVAAADGEVCHVGNDPRGYGLNIKINHLSASGSIMATTLYAHLSQQLVTVGQKVGAGQTIGKEGATGAVTGAHLHFECRLGGTTPVDPTPYIRGSVTEDTPPAPLTNGDGEPVTDSEGNVVTTGGGTETRQNNNPALTQAEVNARTKNDCPPVLGEPAPTTEPNNAPFPTGDVACDKKNRSPCAPDSCPITQDVIAEINHALNEDSSLGAEDKKLIMFIAQIESRLDPYAKNPTSSAMGLYQMLDKIAATYYAQIGSSPTCQNRCDPYLATKAMIKFYKTEIKAYWVGYLTSSKTTIAGKPIKSTPHSARYQSLTQGEFCYGLIHHDGVGNAVNGHDCQGVDYYRRKVRELNFA